MRGKLLLFGILLLLFVLFLAGKFFILDKQQSFGQLKVQSSPATSIFLDTVAIGRTPFDDKVKAGEYLLKLIPEGEASAAASWQGKIKIHKNSLTYVNRELGESDVTSAGEIFTITRMETAPRDPNFGEIYVETEPNGAIVELDGDEKGVAPVILADVPKGTHEISIYLPGFFRRTQKVNIEPKYRVTAQFKLAIDQSQKPPTSKTTSAREASPSAQISSQKIRIRNTPTGFLRVREEPTINASEEAQVRPGDEFDIIEEQGTWYRIGYSEGQDGWISSEYTEKVQ